MIFRATQAAASLRCTPDDNEMKDERSQRYHEIIEQASARGVGRAVGGERDGEGTQNSSEETLSALKAFPANTTSMTSTHRDGFQAHTRQDAAPCVKEVPLKFFVVEVVMEVAVVTEAVEGLESTSAILSQTH